jgi:hypothetical protein
MDGSVRQRAPSQPCLETVPANCAWHCPPGNLVWLNHSFRFSRLTSLFTPPNVLSLVLFMQLIAIIQKTDARKASAASPLAFWCVRRRRVFEAYGSSQLAVTPETRVSGGPRKGKASMKRNVLIAFFALLVVPLFSQAQGLGSILGRVTDPAGAGVAAAQVTATQEGTGFSRAASTDTDGFYVLPSLKPATYSLTVEA